MELLYGPEHLLNGSAAVHAISPKETGPLEKTCNPNL
jgi:hypothetical protein